MAIAGTVGAMGIARDHVRAEFPPAHYWRRWCADAGPPQLPGEDPTPAPRPVAARQASSGEPPYRVLVVEDDRSQALFAQSVLTGSGMQVLVESEVGRVIARIEEFTPDLVLMDLHIPGIDGAELTDMIRSHASFAHIPIVFLTGDPDPERQYEVLEIGADDFLTKPVRPRHLIAAVENRIKRARQLRATSEPGDGRNPLTGLLTRSRIMEHLGSSMQGTSAGALVFIEVEGTAALRERMGYAAFETLLNQAGRSIAMLARPHLAARLNDNTFLVHASSPPTDLAAWARNLRDDISRQEFQAGGQAIRLRVCAGCVGTDIGLDGPGSALAAAEQALREARLLPTGVAMYAPPPESEAQRALATQLATAIDERRFELAFQPIVAVAGGNEAQFQALLRMRDTDGQQRTAGEIIPLAEAAGLMHQIDRHVMEQVLEVLHERQESGRPVRLFISQSPASLARDGYADWLLTELAGRGCPGASLVIDVRQDDALVHSVSLEEFCAATTPAGVQLCLGQYQPGEDVDAILARLPLAYVRLSGHFSTSLADGAVRDAMRDAVDRAHRSGLQVIGPHVEDPHAAATLWMSGVDYIQGNLVQQVAAALDFDFQHSVL